MSHLEWIQLEYPEKFNYVKNALESSKVYTILRHAAKFMSRAKNGWMFASLSAKKKKHLKFSSIINSQFRLSFVVLRSGCGDDLMEDVEKIWLNFDMNGLKKDCTGLDI